METIEYPKAICVGKTTWSEEMVDGWPVYFSEENVKHIMKQVVEDANSLIGCARRSAVFTTKLDESKYIPHIINLLKGDSK